MLRLAAPQHGLAQVFPLLKISCRKARHNQTCRQSGEEASPDHGGWHDRSTAEPTSRGSQGRAGDVVAQVIDRRGARDQQDVRRAGSDDRPGLAGAAGRQQPQFLGARRAAEDRSRARDSGATYCGPVAAGSVRIPGDARQMRQVDRLKMRRLAAVAGVILLTSGPAGTAWSAARAADGNGARVITQDVQQTVPTTVCPGTRHRYRA
jgi:hypothetical protein